MADWLEIRILSLENLDATCYFSMPLRSELARLNKVIRSAQQGGACEI